MTLTGQQINSSLGLTLVLVQPTTTSNRIIGTTAGTGVGSMTFTTGATIIGQQA